MSARTLEQDTTNGERVFGERYAVVPDFVLTADVSCNAKLLWIAYQRHADPDGRCFPSRRRVAEQYMNGVSIDTVKRAKKELVEAGLIAVDERYDDADNGRRTTDHVTLLRLPRTSVPMGAKRIPTPRYEKCTDVSSNHQEVSNPPKSPLRTQRQSQPPTPEPPRVPLYAEVNPIVHGLQLEPLTADQRALAVMSVRQILAREAPS